MATRNDDAHIAQQAELARAEARTCRSCGVRFPAAADQGHTLCFRCAYPEPSRTVGGETWDELMAAADAVRSAVRGALDVRGDLGGAARSDLRAAVERLRKAQGAAYADRATREPRTPQTVCVNCKRPFGGRTGETRCLECRGQ